VGSIRVFRHEDIPAAARLHQRVFGQGEHADEEEARRRETYLRQVFLGAGDYASPVLSRVYEERGRIVGFLGIVPRDMQYMGKPILAAIASQFVVDHDSRFHMVGIQLLQEYLKGPQDLSVADEANNSARMLWEKFGGTTAFLYSLYWTRVLRPLAYALSLLRGRAGWGPCVAAARPVASVLDAMAAAVPGSPLRPLPTDVVGESPPDERLWSYLPEFCADHRLRPEYDLATWTWVLQRAQAKPGCGTFHRMAVKDRGKIVGWYLYYLNPRGISEVVQMAAKPKCEEAVLNHLLQHAWQGGAAAVSGRLNPGWLPVLSERREHRCVFHRGPWVLVHATRPDLTQVFSEGTAFFSRLEGEWCLRYQ
jgi:predicted N-acetyltransferase YhbS